jgi:hypothetical protein
MVQYIHKYLSSHHQDMIGIEFYFPPEKKTGQNQMTAVQIRKYLTFSV